MYLSRIWLDTRNRDTMWALSNPNRFHGALEACDPDRSRKLWRMDDLAGRKCLLVLSDGRLDLSHAAGQFGIDSYEQAPYDRVLDRIVVGSCWQFRLVANPTYRRRNGDKSMLRGHVSPAHQARWLIGKSAACGFTLDPDGFGIMASRNVIFDKATGEKVQFKSCHYEGLLEVSDVDAFRAALVGGIGREKAYGQGLMTIVPA